MTDDEALVWQRAQAALDSADATLERLAQRQAERVERGEREWRPPEQPEAAFARQRAAEPSYKREERRIIETRALVDSKIAAAVAQVRAQSRKDLEAFADMLGEEVAEITKRERELWRGEFTAALDAAKAELRAEFEARLEAAETRDVSQISETLPAVRRVA